MRDEFEGVKEWAGEMRQGMKTERAFWNLKPEEIIKRGLRKLHRENDFQRKTYHETELEGAHKENDKIFVSICCTTCKHDGTRKCNNYEVAQRECLVHKGFSQKQYEYNWWEPKDIYRKKFEFIEEKEMTL